MMCQQEEEEQQLSYDHELPLPLAMEPARPSWNCVMDIDNKEHKLYGSTLPSPKQKQPRRSVSFQSSSTLCCYHVPEDEPQDWYTGEDEEIFKAAARKEVNIFQRMKGGGRFAGTSEQSASDPQLQLQQNLCLVGLEQQLVSPEFSKKRARTKKLVKHAVLVEQCKIETGCGDKDKAERIAEAAIRYSEWSAAQAKMRGDFQYIQSKKGC